MEPGHEPKTRRGIAFGEEEKEEEEVYSYSTIVVISGAFINFLLHNHFITEIF